MRFEATLDEDHWANLPWLTAGFGALAGLLFFLLGDSPSGSTLAIWRQAMAAFVGVAALSLLITVDRLRPLWSLLFALAWGLVIAAIGYHTAGYNRVPNIFEWPFLSGLAAVALAAPLFQTARDAGAARFPSARIHHHVWTDATMVAVALLFTGVTFLVAVLIAELFKVIGIDALENLLQEGQFSWSLAGAAFGGAIGLMRLRETLLATVRKLVMVILSVLGPVLAAALWGFLLSLPFTGLERFWSSGVPPTPLLLLGGFGAFALTNLLIGASEEDEPRSAILRWSALALAAVVLPLAVLAALSLSQRIGQYGWTPERLWGVVAVGVALAYGAIAWLSLGRERIGFARLLRPLQVRLALGVCALALLLALPVIDFGRISAGSQLARLEQGKMSPEDFDWRALAFDFGPAGRRQLARIAQSGSQVQRTLARTALSSKTRYEVEEDIRTEQAWTGIDQRIRMLPRPFPLDPQLKRTVAREGQCVRTCVLYQVSPGRVVVVGQPDDLSSVQSAVLNRNANGDWSRGNEPGSPRPQLRTDLARATVEVRSVNRRQLFVNGRPVGEPFE